MKPPELERRYYSGSGGCGPKQVVPRVGAVWNKEHEP